MIGIMLKPVHLSKEIGRRGWSSLCARYNIL